MQKNIIIFYQKDYRNVNVNDGGYKHGKND